MKVMENGTRYSREENENLNFYECIGLLDTLVDNGFIQRAPNNENNILIYRSGGYSNPEGLYSENLMEVAEELFHTPEDVNYLRNVLKENGIKLTFEVNYLLDNCPYPKESSKERQRGEER